MLCFKTPLGVLPWTCWVKGNDRADRRVGKATLTSGLLLGRSAVLRSLRHYKAKDITPLIASRREAWKEEALDDLPWKDERGGIVNQTNLGTLSKAKLRKLLREGVECIYGLFQAHLEPSWTVAGDSPCASNNGGCEQLCFALPNPNNTTPDTAKCGCASGALSSDGKTCQGDDLLVMSLCSVLILCIWHYSGTVETGHITWKSFKIKVVVGL